MYVRTYVEENATGSTATWVDLPGRPTWTDYISISGTTDTVTVGNHNFRCGDLMPNAASSYDIGTLLTRWNMVYTNGLMVHYSEPISAVYGVSASRHKITWVADPTSSMDAASKKYVDDTDAATRTSVRGHQGRGHPKSC
jgi:hypothetical protein